MWASGCAGGLEPAGDGGASDLVVLGEVSDAGAGVVPLREVGGDVGSGEQAVVLGSGGEGGASDAEGPGGGGHGPVGGESLADLVFGEVVAAVGLAPARGDTDAAEADLEAAAGHTGSVVGLSQKERDLLVGWASPPTFNVELGRESDPPGRGKCLVKIAQRPGCAVDIQLTQAEKDLHNTNARWQMQGGAK